MTPNRFDGRDSTRWWSDLPPGIRARFSPVYESQDEPVVEPARENQRVFRMTGRFALLLLFAVLSNLVVILLALWLLAPDAGVPAPHESASNP